MNIKDKARQDAFDDWNNKCVSKQFAGHVYSDEPAIDASGFYLSLTNEGMDYAAGYNSCVKELLEEHGLPLWSPGARKIRENEIEELFSKSVEISSLDLQQKEDRNLVRDIILIFRDNHGVKPTSFVYLKDRDLIVFFVKIDCSLRIEVVDMHYKVWMQSFNVEMNENKRSQSL